LYFFLFFPRSLAEPRRSCQLAPWVKTVRPAYVSGHQNDKTQRSPTHWVVRKEEAENESLGMCHQRMVAIISQLMGSSNTETAVFFSTGR